MRRQEPCFVFILKKLQKTIPALGRSALKRADDILGFPRNLEAEKNVGKAKICGPAHEN